jgi:dipeptidyl aminopeptidase/acylaminoacyl peptidase
MRISMRLSSALPVLAAVFVLPGFSSGQNAAPAGGTSPAGPTSAPAERPTMPSAKRPMTFEDMMAMKRLGDTAVSPDGKWLAYAVTTVDLDQNTKTMELWLQAISGASDRSSGPFKLGVGQPGDSGVQFAPDGKRILWVSGRDGGQQVWIADFDTATGATSNAKKLTAIATEADNAKWSPDSKSIVLTSAVYPDCAAISAADFATGNQCNADRDKALATSPVKAQIWTQLLYRHWNHYTGEKRSHLFLVLVDGSGMRDLTPGDVHDVPPFSLEGSGCGCDFSPDAKELAFTENPDPVPAISTSVQVFTLDLTNPAAKPVKVSTSAGGNFDPAYSPDGKWLAWRSEARAGYESDKFRLFVYDRAAKTIRDLLPKFDRWVDEFAWAEDSRRIYFVSEDFGEAPMFRIDLPEAPPIQLTAAGEFSNIHVLPDDSIVVAGMMVDSPGEIFHLHSDQVAPLRMPNQAPPGRVLIPTNFTSERVGSVGELAWDSARERITHLNDTLLSQLDLPKMESFWFTAADKTKLQGFIIRPPGFDPSKKYPLKFLIHGGPQGNWGDDWSYRWNAELFAANGYVVVMINPRGSTGYGQAIVDGVNGDWGGKPFTDLMEGLDYAEQHYPFIDKDRECALGASYGGYMANWVLGHTNRFKCIVSHDGMFDAESAFGSTEEDWFNIWEFKFPNTQGGHPWDYYGKPDAENPYRKWSPSLYAKNFKTPTLVVHGQLDYRLDVSEGFQLFDTLQMLGVPSKMLYFPDEGHWVLKPQNSQLWWKTVNDWVDEWTKSSH